MRGNGNGAIDSVLRTAELDHASDRILAQFWLPQASRGAGGGTVTSLAAFRAQRTAR